MELHEIKTFEDFSSLKNYASDNFYSSATVAIKNSNYSIQFTDSEQFIISMPAFQKTEQSEIYTWIKSLKNNTNEDKSLIFGKDNTQNIVSLEVKDETIELFIEKDGIVTSKFLPNKYWIVSPKKFNDGWKPLKGNLFYKYIKYYDDINSYYKDKRTYRDAEIFSVGNPKEAAMLLNGFTHFKGMKVEDVSILSFDIEGMGLAHNPSSRVLMITNTFRRGKSIERKSFSCDEFESDGEMLEAWTAWVREKNPSIVSGFNVFGYDFPYLNYCASKAGVTLSLGRDGSNITFDKYESKFRKDGSQDYDYKRCHIYGREIVDMMFVAYHYDFSRKYERYALKEIIKHEGLAREGRQYYDAANIGKDWEDLEKRKLIKQYGQDDSDENLALYDLMIPSFFYLSSSIPKTFQQINYTASGSQLNAFLIRAYLQQDHSLPKTSEVQKFEGAISFGVPGIYSNMLKIDFSALYPNIIRQFGIYDKGKDPKGYLLKMTNYFTDERLKNKKLAKQTGDKYYSDLEQSQKIVANSIYGLLGAKLNFNYPAGAAEVTRIGRELLKFSIFWATGKNIDYWLDEFNKKTGNEKEEDETL